MTAEEILRRIAELLATGDAYIALIKEGNKPDPTRQQRIYAEEDRANDGIRALIIATDDYKDLFARLVPSGQTVIFPTVFDADAVPMSAGQGGPGIFVGTGVDVGPPDNDDKAQMGLGDDTPLPAGPPDMVGTP